MSQIPPNKSKLQCCGSSSSLNYFGEKRVEETAKSNNNNNNNNNGEKEKTMEASTVPLHPSVLDLVTVDDISPLPPARSSSSATKTKNTVPGAYSQQPGRESVLLGAPNKSVLVCARTSGTSSSSSNDSAKQKKRGRMSLPEAIPITAEVVEAEEARERRASIQSTIFQQEVHQQREYYGMRLEALEAENEELQDKITTANIQATIFQQEHQQQRNYYETRMEHLARENQKLKRTIRKMEIAHSEAEDVIRAREVDKARYEVYALQEQLEKQLTLVEQAHEMKLQMALAAKDQELYQALQEIEQLQRQLAAASSSSSSSSSSSRSSPDDDNNNDDDSSEDEKRRLRTMTTFPPDHHTTTTVAAQAATASSTNPLQQSSTTSIMVEDKDDHEEGNDSLARRRLMKGEGAEESEGYCLFNNKGKKKNPSSSSGRSPQSCFTNKAA